MSSVGYVFAQQPREATRSKYRPTPTSASASTTGRGGGVNGEDDGGILPPANIMHDARVYRGSTLASRGGSGGSGDDENRMTSNTSSQRRIAAARTTGLSLCRPARETVADIHNSLVLPRKRTAVPFHLYLEEQPTDEGHHHHHVCEIAVQTDAFLPVPEAKPYIAPKRGVDTGTQIDTDLVFRFDRDVEPLLQVLVDGTVEQALTEVRREEEMRDIARRWRDLHRRLATEAAARAQLEAEEVARFADKERLLTKGRARVLEQQKQRQLLVTTTFARDFVDSLVSRTFAELEERRFFVDPVHGECDVFMEWTVDSVAERLAAVNESYDAFDAMIGSVADNWVHMQQQQQQQRQRQADEERRLNERDITLYVHSNLSDAPVIGPVHLAATATISDVCVQVAKWLTEERGVCADRIVAPVTVRLAGGRTLIDVVRLCNLSDGQLSRLQINVELTPPAAAVVDDEERDDDDGGDDEEVEDEEDDDDDEDEDEEEEE